jgi:hypothetical protein
VDALVAAHRRAKWGTREFLALGLEEEGGVREGRRFTQSLTLPGLPSHKTRDSFDVAFESSRLRSIVISSNTS